AATAWGTSVAGDPVTASGSAATAWGAATTAAGRQSTAWGAYTRADSFLSTALGFNNRGGGDPDNWVLTDPLFEIGNSQNEVLPPKNALLILKNGDTAIGDITPESKLHVDGTIRAAEYCNDDGSACFEA